MQNLIGGFFELHSLLDSKPEDSLWDFWNLNEKNCLFLENARSCLYQLIVKKELKKIWLPAYICSSVIDAVAHAKLTINFYPLTDQLSPDTSFLSQNIETNDAVLAVDYFGLLPDENFLQFVRLHEDIVWIEDKAQALLPDETEWGDYTLYSPRKLLGIPDGGILKNKTNHLNTLDCVAQTKTIENLKPALLRFEDTQQKNNSIWYEKYLLKERQQAVTNKSMSRLSKEYLRLIKPEKIIGQRLENHKILHLHLAEYSFFKKFPAIFTPFAFMMQHENRDDIAGALANENIFAAKHWDPLSVEERHFSFEKKLSKQLLSLPCDHRYNEKDMSQIIKIIQRLL